MEDPVGAAAKTSLPASFADSRKPGFRPQHHIRHQDIEVVADPPDFVDWARNLHPSIIALWHGQFFLLPGMYPPEIPGRAVVARHDDAEALARVLRKFGLGLIRGAGAAGRRRDRGGAEAAHGAVASLREGFSVA